MCQKYYKICDALKVFDNMVNNEYISVKYYYIILNKKKYHNLRLLRPTKKEKKSFKLVIGVS